MLRSVIVILILSFIVSPALAQNGRRAVVDAADAFEAASRAVGAYADVAQTILSKGPKGAPEFDTQRTHAALTMGKEHLVLFAPVGSGQMSAAGLDHLMDLHFRIAKIQNALPIMLPSGFDLGDVRSLLAATRAQSRYLSEVFAHVARVHRAGLGGLSLASARGETEQILTHATGEAKLAALVAEHKANISRLKATFGARLGSSRNVAPQPLSFPIVLAYAEGEGDKLLAYVWVPGSIAKPMIERYDAEQADVIAKKIRPENAKPR